MIETVRRGLAERGLERGCRFIVTANLLDDMRVYLLFNRLGCDPERVLDGGRRAGAMRDDTDAVDAKKWAAAVLLVIRFGFDAQKRILCQKRTGLSYRCAVEFVFKPLENCHRDRLARLQNHVPNKTVANHNFDRFLKQMPALDIADKVERTLLEHFEDFLGLLSAFHVFFAERYQTDRRTLVAENVARINRAHKRVLKKVFGPRVDVCARIDQNKNIRFCWKYRCDAGTVDARQCTELDRTRGDSCSGVARAHDRICLAAFHKVDGATHG